MKVEHYSFGRIRIDGKEYTSDVIVGLGYLRDGWWRKEGHRVQLEDVASILDLDFEVIIFGTGANGRVRVDDEVVRAFKERGKEVIVAMTGEAVKVYNELLKKNRKVILAAHLTC
jgi:hypothetical protein